VRVLVTGASGFLGRPLVALLESEGAQVTRFQGDVRDPAAYPQGPFDAVLHLAAISNVARSIAEPALAWDVNANGTQRLMEWARGADVGRVVFVSSAQVYGKARVSPISESHPTLPTGPYGASKLAAEAAVRGYGATYGVEFVIVRPFNMYGPGQERGFLVPDVLHQIAEGKSLVTGDLTPVRDFTFVEDAARFLSLAARVPGAAGATLNLGSGEGHSAGEIVDLALRVSGSKLRPTQDPARLRPAEIPELVVDNALARRTLGWAPRVTLEEGLRRAWRAMTKA